MLTESFTQQTIVNKNIISGLFVCTVLVQEIHNIFRVHLFVSDNRIQTFFIYAICELNADIK